jgi:RNA polymerase sigma-70 factor (sigma-E family)
MAGPPVSRRDNVKFGDFVQRFSPGLVRSAWLLCGSWTEAEDLVQIALAKTWIRWDSIAPGARLAYVRRVLVTSYLKSAKRTLVVSNVELSDLPDPARRHEEVEARAAIIAAMRALPAKQRAVLTLRYFEGLTERETAQALHCSIGTVKVDGARAMRTLRATPGLV